MDKYFNTNRFVNYFKLSLIENKKIIASILIVFILLISFTYYLSLNHTAFFLGAQIQAKFFVFFFFPFIFSMNLMHKENKAPQSIFYLILPVSFVEKWLVKYIILILIAAILWVAVKIIDYSFLRIITEKYHNVHSVGIPNPQDFEPIGFENSKNVYFRSSGFDLNFFSIIALAIIAFSVLKNLSNFRTATMFFILLLFFGVGKNRIIETILNKNIRIRGNEKIEIYEFDISKIQEVKIPNWLSAVDYITMHFIIPISLVMISLLVTKQKELSR